MLARIITQMDAGSAPDLGALQAIAYGGGRMPPELIERELTLFPNTGFTNAYGLTETSSTVALLGPDDHPSAHQSDHPPVRARPGAVGQPFPPVPLEIRAADAQVVPGGQRGETRRRGQP